MCLYVRRKKTKHVGRHAGRRVFQRTNVFVLFSCRLLKFSNAIVQKHLEDRLPNKVLNDKPPPVSKSEEFLPRKIRRTLAQIRTNNSPLLLTYKHKIDPHTRPNPLCPLYKIHDHDTTHLFNCTHIPTHLTPMDLRKKPCGGSGPAGGLGAEAG